METNIVAPVGKQENIIEMSIIQRIHEIRGMRVMLDFDLAEIYQVPTKRLKEQVRRNIDRFPGDFMFQLSDEEWKELVANCDQLPNSIKHSYIIPLAFTQEGVAMMSGVLRSQKAIQENIRIMRAFVALRQYVLNYAELKHELNNFMHETNSRLDKNDIKFDALFALFDEYIAYKKELEKPRNRIGFKTSANRE
jgi:hypothetical protein